jgi:hypothetical protein
MMGTGRFHTRNKEIYQTKVEKCGQDGFMNKEMFQRIVGRWGQDGFIQGFRRST